MLLMFLTVGFMRGMIVLRNLQVRSETTARLTDASTQAIEEWKTLPGDERREGLVEITTPQLQAGDYITLDARRDTEAGVWRVTVLAQHNDARQPVRLSLSTEALE
jgi:hypothetical protein